MQTRYLAAGFLGLVGLVLAIIAYAGPLGNTGVDGTLGALLALIGALVTCLGAGLLAFRKLPSRPVVIAVLVVAAVLTAIAGYFLMQFALAVVMAAAALALVAAPFLSSPRRAV